MKQRFLHLLHLISYRHIAYLQGLFFFLGGLWPLISMETFLAVTGPKADLWLVETVSLLLVAIGSALLIAGYRRIASPEVFTLAIGSAASLAAIEIIYVARGRISPVYLLDTVAELFLIALWIRDLIHRHINEASHEQ